MITQLVNAWLVVGRFEAQLQSAKHVACKWLKINVQYVVPYPLERKAAAVQLPGAWRKLILLAASLDVPGICAATMTSLQKQYQLWQVQDMQASCPLSCMYRSKVCCIGG